MDVSAVRSVKKRNAAKVWLKAHGYDSFDQVFPMNLEVLRELLTQFESVNLADDAPQHPLSEPDFQAPSSEAGTSR